MSAHPNAQVLAALQGVSRRALEDFAFKVLAALYCEPEGGADGQYAWDLEREGDACEVSDAACQSALKDLPSVRATIERFALTAEVTASAKPDSRADDELTATYRRAAREAHHVEGKCEVDDNAAVSFGGDRGAYVQSWVWVPCPTCNGTGVVEIPPGECEVQEHTAGCKTGCPDCGGE